MFRSSSYHIERSFGLGDELVVFSRSEEILLICAGVLYAQLLFSILPRYIYELHKN